MGSIPTRSRQIFRPFAAWAIALAVAGAVPAGGAEPDSVRAGKPAIWWVTVRSGILPGWGQLANGQPVKAVLFAGVDAWWFAGVLRAESERREAQEELDRTGSDPALEEAVNAAVDRRNFRLWMMGATTVLSMLDAYVDAHFFGYDSDWRAGLEPSSDGARLSVSYHF